MEGILKKNSITSNAFIILAVCLLPVSSAAGGSDSFIQALTHALDHNPEIKAAQAKLVAAQERLPQSRAELMPNLAVNVTPNSSHSSWRGGGTSGQSVVVGATLSQMLYNRPVLIALDQTVPWIGAAADDLDGVMQTVFFKVAKATVDLLQAKEIVRLAENNQRVMQQHLTSTQTRHRVGELTRTNISQAEARLATAHADHTRANNDLAVARAQFFEVVGKPAGESLSLPRFRHSPGEGSLESWLVQLEQRPDMRATSKRLSVAESAIKQEQAGHWPTLSLSSGASHVWQKGGTTVVSTTEEEADSYTLGMRMDLPLYSGGMTLSKTAEAQARRDAQWAELDRLRRQAYREIEKAYLDLQSSQALTTSFNSIVAAAKMARDGVEREFRVGTRTSLDLLDSERELFSNQTNLAKNRYSLELARFQMLLVVGRLTLEELLLPQ
ncbi:MAG: TolC family outer membrane protein [Magnetococcales bacterium]|nr:TolC family outer membrane protein [Magnetococcales bacterium]